MSPEYEFAYHAVMVGSIIAAFWLEALLPLEQDNWNFEHLARNFSIWLLAFLCANYIIGYYWVQIEAIILQQAFGIFYWLSLPEGWLLVVLGVLITDLAEYLYHRISHQNRFLWRLHAVHHTDTKLDVSTTLRTHPLELLISSFWKMGVALLCGIPLWVVGARELLVFPLVFLQHANVALPDKFERVLGYVLITPVIHRLHHSIIQAEHDSNYGEGLVLWDTLFRSFKQPVTSRPVQYGVSHCTAEKHQTLNGMLLTPLRIYNHEPTA